MNAPVDLLVLADINPDLVLSDPELEVTFDQVETLVDGCELTIGGSGAIMACAAARLGLRTAICGIVGADQFGRFMCEALAERGVDISGVIVDPAARTGLTVVLARPGSDRAILTFPGAIAALTADRVDAQLLSRARHVHVAAWFMQRALWPGAAALLARARSHGASTSLDPNWDPSGEWDHGLRPLLGELDVLLPNAAEARQLADVQDVAAAARALAAAGPLVAVKLGGRGALACAPDGTVSEAGPPPGPPPVDTVGAGDAFDAGFLAARLDGADVERALALGCACGQLSTRAAGGTAAQPTLAQARAAVTDPGVVELSNDV